MRPRLLAGLMVAATLLGSLHAELIAVKYKEGSVHGFLSLTTLDGKIVASGDLLQVMRGDLLISHLTYHFRNGSIDDETAVFTQNGHFRLISDHHIQKGPEFKQPMDVLLKMATGEVTVRYEDKGQQKVETSHVDLPPDLANGIIFDLLKNISPDVKETRLSYLVATPKPRVVQFVLTPQGEETYRIAGVPNKAERFKVKVDLGGITGVVAPLIGKQPADSTAWISTGQVPAFVKSEAPLYLNGPMLRIQLTSPAWPRTSKGAASGK